MDDSDSVSDDSVNNVDRVLVGLGVAILGLPVTFAILNIWPARLNGTIVGQKPASDTTTKQLGPGVFFILSFLALILVLQMYGPGNAPDTKSLDGQATFEAGYNAGFAVGEMMRDIQDRLVSGNIWSAAIVAIPVYMFALALALCSRLLVGSITTAWTSAHAVGASLYIVGGLIFWTVLLLACLTLASSFLPTMTMAIIAAITILAALGLTGVQTYGFVSDLNEGPDWLAGLAATATPLIIIAMMTALTLLAGST